MLVSIASDAAIREMAEPAWKSTRRLRGSLHHGVRPCPQTASQFRRADDEETCDRCSELMNLALMEGRQRLIKQGVTEVEADDLRARTYRLAKSWVLSARDRLAGEFGMTVRPNRLVKAGWFVRAVPDQIDQQLVIDTVYFARSYDAPAADGQPFPYAALGRKHKITADAARDRLLAALVRLGELKAEWLDANIFLPMSRRLSEGQDDGDLSNTGYTDHEFERVDDPEAWAHEHG